MEFVDGLTVRQMLRQQGRIEEKTALNIVGAVARALEHAHRHGIIHRDIKPDNIIVSRDGVVKLADLGLARTTEKPDTLTIEGVALGTPYYMAPEQVRATTELDTRTDIYALGATLFHMVTGEFPYDGPKAGAIMAKQIAEPVPAARERNPQVSRACDELIQRMMAKDPADRPQTPAELLEEIRDALAGKVHLRAKPEGRRQTTEDRRQRAHHRQHLPLATRHSAVSPGLVATLAIAAIVLVVALILTLRPKPPATAMPPPPSVPEHRTPITERRRELTAKTPEDARKTAVSPAKPPRKETAPTEVVDDAEAKRRAAEQERIAKERQEAEELRRKAEAALAAYQAESDKVWALFKARDYPEADKLLANLPKAPNLREVIGQVPDLREVTQADLEAAKLLKEFWAAVERGVLARRGKFVSIAGRGGNVEAVRDGQVTLSVGDKQFVQPLLRMDAAQAAALADLKDDERGNLTRAIFLLAEGEKLDDAQRLLAAAGAPPSLPICKARLDRILGHAKARAEARDAEAREAAAQKAWQEIEGLGAAKLSVTGAKRLLALLDEFVHKHEATKAGEAARERIAAMRERASEAAQVEAKLSGYALQFDGDDDDVEVPFVEAHWLKSGVLTVEARFCMEAPARVPAAIVVKRPPRGGPRGGTFIIRLEHDIPVYFIATAAPDRWSSVRGPAVELGRWYHAALSYDGKRLAAYLDGEMVAELLVSRPLLGDECPIHIGRENFDNATFAGRISEVRLWNSVRTPDEIRQNMTRALKRTEQGLVGYWDFTDGKGDLLHDRTRNRAHGKIAGAKWATLEGKPNAGGPAPRAPDGLKAGEWQDLFDGKSLRGWRVVEGANFGADPRVAPRGGMLLFERGGLDVGLRWTDEFPRTDYEVSVEFRLDAVAEGWNVVFPVGDSHCRLVLGGWGGSVVRVDMVDGAEASANRTTRRMRFEAGRWYVLAVRVTQGRIHAWLERDPIIDLPREGHVFSLHQFLEPMKPFGIYVCRTTAAVRNIRLRRLAPGQ